MCNQEVSTRQENVSTYKPLVSIHLARNAILI
jgi:hypothetical protein